MCLFIDGKIKHITKKNRSYRSVVYLKRVQVNMGIGSNFLRSNNFVSILDITNTCIRMYVMYYCGF